MERMANFPCVCMARSRIVRGLAFPLGTVVTVSALLTVYETLREVTLPRPPRLYALSAQRHYQHADTRVPCRRASCRRGACAWRSTPRSPST